MASIEKLSIRGIRSFSADREQVIEFYKPLTVIVGANGCGKTTIIECLKYASTGALPPNAQAGKTFVHDPKMSKKAEIKAQIKMRFTNRGGQPMVCLRSMQVQQKKKNLTFKGLDGVIRMTDPSGEKVSMSHKCSELDKQIPELLGVSKAILENVIFVHQEDSNWPLAEPKKLKDKFDDIFESTRYSKALKAITEAKKEKSNLSKDFKRDLDVLQTQMGVAASIQRELHEAEEKLSENRTKVQDLNEQIAQQDAVIRQYQDTISDMQVYEIQVQQLQVKIEEKEREVERAFEACDYEMQETDEQLQGIIDSYDAELAQASESITEKEEEQRRLQAQKADAERMYNQLCTQKGKIEAECGAHRDMVEELRHKEDELSQKYSPLSADLKSLRSSLPFDDHARQQFGAAMKTLFEAKRDELRHVRKQQQDQEDILTAEYTELHAQIRHHEQEARAKKKRKDEVVVQGKSVARELKSLKEHEDDGYTEQSRAEAQEKYATASEEYEEFRNNGRGARLAAELKTLQKQQHDEEYSQSELEESITKMENFEEEENKLKARKVRLHSDEQALQEEMDINQGMFERLLEHKVILDSLADDVQLAEQKKMHAQASKQKSIDIDRKVRKEHAQLQAQRNTVQHSLQKAQEDLDGTQEDVQKALPLIRAAFQSDQQDGDNTADRGLEDYAEACKKMEEKEKKAGKDAESVGFVKSFYMKILKKSKKNKKCLCCDRAMNDQDYEAMKACIEQKTCDQEFVKTEQKYKQTLEHVREQHTALKQARSAVHTYMRLRPQIESQQAELEQFTPRLEELEHRIAESQRLTKSAEEAEEEANQLLPLLNGFTRRHNEVRRLRKKLMADQKDLRDQVEMTVGADMTTLKELRDQRKKIMEALTVIQKQISEQQKQQNQHMEQSNALQVHRSRAHDKLKEIEEQLGRLVQLKNKQQELHNLSLKLGKEIQAHNDAIEPLKSQQVAKQTERDAARQNSTKHLDHLNDTLNTLQTHVQSNDRLRASVNQQLRENKEGELQRVEGQLMATTQKVDDAKSKLAEIEPVLSELKTTMDKKDIIRRSIQDNVNYRSLKAELGTQKSELQEVETKLHEVVRSSAGEGGIDVHQTLQQARKQMAKLREHCAGIQGQGEIINAQVRSQKVKLKQDEFRGIEKRHRKKMIEYETTSLAVQDLEKYYNALDQALMKYHGMKVTEINKILQELWQITYKGGDIDSIEIQSGQDSAKTQKATRSYNYRVVMRKGDAELDMRGRCSAGQKVLAGLVIRLALAETFCLNCGILALDEPTTNLDQENKVGLAQAMIEIINARAKQENFQLICITHDEEFVQMLGKAQLLESSKAEYYWRISREELEPRTWYSRIDRQDWEM